MSEQEFCLPHPLPSRVDFHLGLVLLDVELHRRGVLIGLERVLAQSVVEDFVAAIAGDQGFGDGAPGLQGLQSRLLRHILANTRHQALDDVPL